MGRDPHEEDSPDVAKPGDWAEGLPDGLVRALSDQSVIVPQDAAVFEALAKWRNAPSNTASANPGDWSKP